VCGAAFCLAVVGATGTGKSALADALAVFLDGEVVNADSMQVYRGMDIGTAKVPPRERGVPYHCIDLVDPGTAFTAARYQRVARPTIETLLARGATPVLCGGTGLYVRVVLDDFRFDEGRDEDESEPRARGLDESEPRVRGLDESEPRADESRARLQAQADEMGAGPFHASLAERDPASAALIHPHNTRRVIRAFELIERGTSYARQHEGFTRFEAVYPVRFIGLTVEPVVLYEAIERRVDTMMALGLLDEVRGLLARGFREAATAQQAIGYKELVSVLEGGSSLEDAVARIKQATRRYAKRQRTWFKRDDRIEWIDVTDLHQMRLKDELDVASFTQRARDRALDLLQ
jgi:tRNA dimethylallyltransferase